MGGAALSCATRWRMILAAIRLRDSGESIAVVAGRVGYGSEFAFAEAFEREFGVAPGRYRKDSENPELIAVWSECIRIAVCRGASSPPRWQ
ncbi:helix-turn-helix domain-containing protein [Nocardia fusca]|uniref:helix-turn-helix domain-containing protein n=1 Tax=Nocardia fusca TaxID=941183 RepID=UPI0037CC887D